MPAESGFSRALGAICTAYDGIVDLEAEEALWTVLNALIDWEGA